MMLRKLLSAFRKTIRPLSRQLNGQFLAAMCFVTISVSATVFAGIEIPFVDSRSDTTVYTQFISEFGDCREALMEERPFPIDERETWSTGDQRLLREVIQFANSLFERRNWTQEMLDGRFDVAMDVKERSRYAAIRKGDARKPRKRDPIVGTIGVTYARYGKNLREKVPMEKTLDVDLPRPGNKGIIFELRTYAKDKVEGAHVFPQLLASALKMIFSELKKYPELYDTPVLYLYGDDLSVRFYRLLGFKVLDPNPVEYADSKWWTLVSTPRELEALVKNLDGERYLSNLNQTLNLKLPNGRPVVAAPRSDIWFENAGDLSHVTLNEETEVLSGVYAAAKTELEVHHVLESQDWQIRAKLSRPWFVEKLGFEIPAGTWVEVYSTGDLHSVWKMSRPIFIPSLGVTATSTIDVQYWETRQRKVPRLIEVMDFGKKVDLLPNLSAARRATVTWLRESRNQDWQPFSVDGIASPVSTSDGANVPKGGWVYVRAGQLLSKDRLYPELQDRAIRRFIYRNHTAF